MADTLRTTSERQKGASFIRFKPRSSSQSLTLVLTSASVSQVPRQTAQTKSVRFNNTKEMGVRVTDGKLSICHCAEPFAWNQREMSFFKGRAKLCLRPDMLWCAPQIRAKRLYCFSSASPFVLLCLRGTGVRKRDRERERNTDRFRRD